MMMAAIAKPTVVHTPNVSDTLRIGLRAEEAGAFGVAGVWGVGSACCDGVGLATGESELTAGEPGPEVGG